MAIGALAAAGVGIVGAVLQAGAASDATAVQWANLQFQKQQARKQERLATAARTDAFGNRQRYDSLTNEWVIDLDPQQQAIIDANEREEFLRVTEDAQRRRDLARRQEQRSRQAGREFERLSSEFKHNRPQSERGFIADATRASVHAQQDGINQAIDAIAKQAMRTGNKQQIQSLLETRGELFGDALDQAITQGTQVGRQQKIQADQAHNNTLLPAIAQFAQLSDRVLDIPFAPTQLPQQLQQLQGQQAQGIFNANSQASANIGNAFQSLSQSIARQAPNLSGIASALSGLGRGSTRGQQQQFLSGEIVDPVFLPENRQTGNLGTF